MMKVFILMMLLHLSAACPADCDCYYNMNYFITACSGNDLTDMPDEISNKTQVLDFSINSFSTIPRKLSSFYMLEHLNMSGNQIQFIASDALSGLSRLTLLDLSKNLITAWSHINPNHVLIPTNVQQLILSGNNLNNLTNSENNLLHSDTLEILELSHCDLNLCEVDLNHLTSLKTLDLSFNLFRRFGISSDHLENLDVSNCKITRLSNDTHSSLPSLRTLDISYNFKLDVSKRNPIISKSLTTVNLASCNLNSVLLSMMPNLSYVSLRRNMLREITGSEFYNNSKMKYLDLSSNSINNIHPKAFEKLASLKVLNLSVNVIPTIHRSMFASTVNLTNLILSRNYIKYLDDFSSPSIQDLDLSRCEIESISPNIFNSLTSLVSVQLSQNIISDLPTIKSTTLQRLDLSLNRINSIHNETFKYLPKLRVLDLSNNRFTTMLKPSYFTDNVELREIKLFDNVWQCDCSKSDIKEFYEFLAREPQITELSSLKCNGPTAVEGMTWMEACGEIWHPNEVNETNKAMNFLMAVLGSFLICFFILWLVKRMVRKRMLAAERERLREEQERRDHLRQLEIAREQQAQLNAPDPRDLVSPPNYDEAVLMPKLDRSYYSMTNLNGNKKKKKRTRRARSSGDLLNDAGSDVESQTDRRRNRTQSTSNIENDDDVDESAQPNMRLMYESDL